MIDFIRAFCYLLNTKKKVKMGHIIFFYSLVCFVFLIPSFSSSFDHHLCSPIDASALLQFKQPFVISDDYSYECYTQTSFPKTKSWNESRDCCTWDGVTCDSLAGHVIGLDLSCSGLGGSIHPNSSLFQLHHLHTLNLAGNNFSRSSIPNGIGRLRNLKHLNLSESLFEGRIPTEISYLSNLVSLDLSCYGCELDQKTFETMLQKFTNLEVVSLSSVNIASPIPVNMSSSLRYVDLTDTNLRGVLTESFFLLPNLERLNLGGNDLIKGVSPNIHPNNALLELDISHSGISGELPDSIGTLSSLNYLNLQYCHFSGPIPDSIGNLTQIRELYLSDNHFTGHIPSTISNLKQLTILDLSSNSFGGEIPNVFSNLQELGYLDLSINSFIGPFPSSILSLTRLQRLDSSSNFLSNELPDSIGNLTQIRELEFRDNHFTGHIPSNMSKLKQLTYLDLSSNSLGGEIPEVLSNLQELVQLYLSENSFIGAFPSSILSLASLQSFDLSSNSLSGPLPSNASVLQKLDDLNLSNNSLNGTIPSWVFNINSFGLRLNRNRFNGIADELKTNPALMLLDLSHNQLSGPFPQSLVNLVSLSDLFLSSNNITDNAGIEVFTTMKTLEYVDLSYNPLSWNTNINGSKVTFPNLEALRLSSCELKDFPHFLRNLKKLSSLDLSNNKIHGKIPNWFSNMRWESLWYLNLSQNSLTGHLEQFHYYNLQYLDLKFNILQGPLPSSICNMTSLAILDLSHNYFSGSVPNCFSNMSELLVLDLRRNNFTGRLPPLCGQSTSLSTIVLNGNRLEGTIPMSLLNCHSLEVLDVGNNAINDTFPAWLGTLQVLQVLILKSNKFHGPISTRQKFCFPRLRIFDISHNEFSGSLPTEVFKNFKAMIKSDGMNKGRIKYMEPSVSGGIMYEDSVRLVIKGNDIELERISTIMTAIDLSSNHFEGVIPKILKDLGSLWLLNLSHNNLKGDIPMELGQLNMLEGLDLSWNRLTGKIPQELTRLTFLEKLNLSQNVLVGPIPHGLQFNTFGNDSYGGNLDLCGPPLSKECGTSDSSHVPQPLESEEEAESYFFSGFTWESVVIGYSCGLVVGTVVWSLMFQAGKPKWFVEFFEGIIPHKRRRPKKRSLRRRRT